MANLPFRQPRGQYVPNLPDLRVDMAEVAEGQGPVKNVGPISAVPFHLVSSANNNATLVRATTCWLYAVWATNVNAAIRFLKFYDLNVVPDPAVHLPSFVCGIPGAVAGAGGSIALPVGLVFFTGLALAIVTGSADTNNTSVAAGEIVISIGYHYGTDAKVGG
jgi:hypothetical protein